MSSEAMAWAKRCSGAGSVPQLILILLADWADHEDRAWPGIAKLAELTGRSNRTIIRAIKRLEEEGLIEKSARTAWCALDNPSCLAKGPHKHRTSNVYKLNVGALPASQRPAQGVGDADPDSISDKMSLMEKTAESCGSFISDRMSLEGSISDKTGRSIVTPVSHVCNSDSLEIYSPDPTQTLPAADDDDRDCDAGVGLVESAEETCIAATIAAAPVAPTAQGEQHRADDVRLALIGECLPAPMRLLDAVGARVVADLLSERVEAGWTPSQIRELLDQPLPPRVHRMAGLVARRLRDNVAVDQAPRRLEEAAARRRAERERQRLDDTDTQQEPIDPVFEAVWAQVRAEMPEAGRAARIWETNRRLKHLDAASSQ